MILRLIFRKESTTDNFYVSIDFTSLRHETLNFYEIVCRLGKVKKNQNNSKEWENSNDLFLLPYSFTFFLVSPQFSIFFLLLLNSHTLNPKISKSQNSKIWIIQKLNLWLTFNKKFTGENCSTVSFPFFHLPDCFILILNPWILKFLHPKTPKYELFKNLICDLFSLN